jgi:hypothetical protein
MSQSQEFRNIPGPSASPHLYRSLSLDAYLQSETDLSEPLDEDDLTEEQLRVLYEDEEIDRFLTLFSAVRRNCLTHQKVQRILINDTSLLGKFKCPIT